jgi:hypothetical protein
MAQLSAYQQHVSEFITGTVQQAFADIAEAVNADGEIKATAESGSLPGKIGWAELRVQAPKLKDAAMYQLFTYRIFGSPMGDDAHILYLIAPARVDGEQKNSDTGLWFIPTVPVPIDATVQQVRAHVLPLVEEAIAGYRERSQQYSGS